MDQQINFIVFGSCCFYCSTSFIVLTSVSHLASHVVGMCNVECNLATVMYDFSEIYKKHGCRVFIFLVV